MNYKKRDNHNFQKPPTEKCRQQQSHAPIYNPPHWCPKVQNQQMTKPRRLIQITIVVNEDKAIVCNVWTLTPSSPTH